MGFRTYIRIANFEPIRGKIRKNLEADILGIPIISGILGISGIPDIPIIPIPLYLGAFFIKFRADSLILGKENPAFSEKRLDKPALVCYIRR